LVVNLEESTAACTCLSWPLSATGDLYVYWMEELVRGGDSGLYAVTCVSDTSVADRPGRKDMACSRSVAAM